MLNYFEEIHIHLYAFCIILRHWYGTGQENLPKWKQTMLIFMSSAKRVGGGGRAGECIGIALLVNSFIPFLHWIPNIFWPLFGQVVSAHFQTNCSLDCPQTWLIHSLWYSPSMITLELHGCLLVIFDKAFLSCDYHRDHTRYGLIQWETTLHCNVVSHWLSPYPEWSLLL